MKDLIVDLRAARRRLESGCRRGVRRHARGAADTRHRARPRPDWRPSAIVALAPAAVQAFGGAPVRRTALARSGKPAIAVLYFENHTGDASLDWMRTGLTDMMVTDLSQCADFEVLGADRLYQILRN